MVSERPAESEPDPIGDLNERARQCLRRVARQNPEALADLYDLLASRVYSLALRMLRDTNDAEDVVQDVFTQVWHQAGRYDDGRASVVGWLLMLSRSRALDRMRAKRSRDHALPASDANPDELPTPALGQDHLTVSRDEAARLHRAIGELPALQREAVELAYFEGLTHTELATRLGEPIGTVKTRVRLGIGKLRDALARSTQREKPL